MRNMTVQVYAITLILSAFLLFSVQLLFSKMILPLLGGSPSVWNTAMVFFQALLLAGYAYAHATSQHLGIRTQSTLHLAILFLAAILLPLALPEGAALPPGGNPALWQLGIMAITVGAPFFVVSASAPMIQRWFAGTDHPDAASPYFLYAASNLGSMAALLSYPVLIEPLLTLHSQNTLWAFGYALLILMTLLCALLVWKSPKQSLRQPPHPAVSQTSAPGLRTKLMWTFLAFVPSSLMLGLTTYLTTDIASAPLLWILPLALYLLTFIIVFARRAMISTDLTVSLFTAFFALMMFFLGSSLFVGKPEFFVVPPTIFFFSCLLCHKRLADLRPPAEYLTSFYMYMSLGGVLGGMFNAFAAPFLFPVPLEYTLALCAVILIRCIILADGRPVLTARNIKTELRSTAIFPVIISLVLVYLTIQEKSIFLNLATGISISVSLMALRMRLFSYAVYACGLLLLLSPARQLFHPDILAIERNFFGIIRVMDTPHTRQFMHGTTLHGAQPRKTGDRLNSITYYNPYGGYGDAFHLLSADRQQIGIIGLGVGSLACFSHPGRSFDYYEIDPDVVQISENPEYFTYLHDCGSPYQIIIGDGRLKIAEAANGTYDMIVIDAFSSDNIPVHVLTLEALEIYASKLKPDGFLLYHISNRHLNLEPVVKAIADKAGYHALIKLSPATPTPFNPEVAYFASLLVAVSKDASTLALLKQRGWRDLEAPDGYRPWTDDYANIAAALNMFHKKKAPARIHNE